MKRGKQISAIELLLDIIINLLHLWLLEPQKDEVNILSLWFSIKNSLDHYLRYTTYIMTKILLWLGI